MKPSGGPIDVAVDSTGLSLSRLGGWLAKKWGLGRTSGWIKLHVAADTATNEILAYAITTEDCGDSTCLAPLMDAVFGAGHIVRRLLADAAYDSKSAWNAYAARGIEVAINIRSQYLTDRGKPRSPAEVSAGGCTVRKEQIARILEVGRDRWNLEKGYGMRWKVECTFSDLKRLLGDILRARKRATCALEALGMVEAHIIYKGIRREAASA